MTLYLFDAHAHVAAAGDPPTPAAPPLPGAETVGRLICGVDTADWRDVNAAAWSWAGTIPAFGLHPRSVASVQEGWFEELERLLTGNPAAWLGEAGLDASKRGLAGMDEQDEAFRRQLRLAKRLRRRVNLHCVKAWDRLLAALDEEYLPDGRDGFIVHSFSGPDEHLHELTERGAYFTVGPLFSRRESRRDRGRAARIPGDRLLLESDFILAAGVDVSGELVYALRWLAAARGEDAEALGVMISKNAGRLFHG